MAGTAHPAMSGERAQPASWGRSDAALFALTSVTIVVLALQFALAGLGAFTMDDTPKDNVYPAHVVLGLISALLSVLILGVVLANQTMRANNRTRWLAITLVLTTLVLQPALGEGGLHVPAIGALHGLNGLVIFLVAGWLTLDTHRRRALSRGSAG